MKAEKTLRFKTAGYSITDEIAIDAGPSKCGSIRDGVAFWHDRNGAWVIAYDDVIAIAKAAAKARGEMLEVTRASDAVPE